MIFCTKCGAEIDGGDRFCTECGHVFSKEADFDEGRSIILETMFSKTQKIIAITIAVLLVLGVLTYKIGETLTSKDKVVSRFNQAIISRNPTQLAKYIVSSDPNVSIDSKSIDALVNYLNKIPAYSNEIVKSLNKQSKDISISSSLNGNALDVFINQTINGSKDLFKLKKQGKTWFFYDRYVLELKPVYIKVHSNTKDAQIFFGDDLLGTANKKDFIMEIGPYSPGIYKLKASLKGKYVNLEKSAEVDLVSDVDFSNENKRIKDLDLNLDGYEVSVDSNYKDAKLFSSGKDTGLTIKDANIFGPVSKDGSLIIFAKRDFPWGTVKSEEVKVSGQSSIYLKLNVVNGDVKNTLMETINIYNKSCVEASLARDSSKLKNVSEARKKILHDDIQVAVKSKRMFIGNLINTTFDLDSISIYQKDNKYYAEVSDLESYKVVWYNEGTSVPETNLNEPAWKYTLIYDEKSKKWLINSTVINKDFNPINTKDFTF